MSENEDATLEVLEPDQRPSLARSFDDAGVELDGRNLYLRCAPYDTPAMVADDPPMGDGIPYEESFARGAFDSLIGAADRLKVFLEFEHWSPGATGIAGHAEELESKDDALYGRFRVHNTPTGETTLELVRAGVLTAASVFFQPIRSIRTARGVVRQKVRLERVAVCRKGAYPGAAVLAVRSAIEPDPEPFRLDVPRLGFDPELAALLESSGIVVPDLLRSVE